MPVTRQSSKLSSTTHSELLNDYTLTTTKSNAKAVVAKPSKKHPTDLPIYPFKTAADFEAFLEQNHLISPGIHLKLARKSSGIPSITHAELIEIALCFGWIDSQGNSFDENYFLTRCTPRRSKSLWSHKNVCTSERLLAEGRMRPAGIAAVDAAKADGRWDRAYAGPKNITVQDDLQEALDGNEAAKTFFTSLNGSERYAVLWRVETASPTARAGRIKTLVKGLACGNVPGRKKEQKSQVKNGKGRIQKAAMSQASRKDAHKVKR